MAPSTLPVVNSLNAPFWAAAETGTLRLPHCTVTGRPFWPPSPCSPFAGGADVFWQDVAMVGTVRALAVYHRSFQADFTDRLPYVIALVELEGGVRLHVFAGSPGAICADARVTIRFTQLAPDGPKVLTAERVGLTG